MDSASRPPADVGQHPDAAGTDAPLAGPSRDAAARYVLGRRTPEGGYCYYRTPEWGVEEPNAVTTLESLQILELPAPETAKTGRWLRSVQADDGSFPIVTIGWAAVRGLALLDMRPRHCPLPWLRHLAARLAAPWRVPDWSATVRAR